MSTPYRELGAVVLCGGQSSRMGQPKAWLDFGAETLLQRVVRVCSDAASPVVVVAAPEQELPPLPAATIVAHDPVEGQGPLQGIAVGLETLAGYARYGFVTSTDAPFLVPEFIRQMHALCCSSLLSEPFQVAVAHIDDRHQPLAAVYACELHQQASLLLGQNRRRLMSLIELARARYVDRSALLADRALAAADPELRSLSTLNTPEDYQLALQQIDLK